MSRNSTLFLSKMSQTYQKVVLITLFKILYFCNFSVLFPKIITPKHPLVDTSQGESPEIVLASFYKETFLFNSFVQADCNRF